MARQVVVIGAGIGGLAAAIHARLAGFDVLVLEQREVVGGKAAGIAEKGYRLDPGPSIIILKEIYESLFAKAGRQMADYLSFSKLDPFTRVRYESGDVLDLPAGQDLCVAQLSARFPSDSDRLRWLMDSADSVINGVRRTIFARPYDHPWQFANLDMVRIGLTLGGSKPYKKVVDHWFKSPELRAFFYGFPSYGGQTYDSVAPGAFLIPYLMISEGVFYPAGGVAAIPISLLRLAKDLGVEFRIRTRVKGLVRQTNRIQSVSTSQGNFDCDAVICNVDRYTMGQWLDRIYDLAPSLSYFTIHWGIRRKAEQLLCHTLLVPKDFESGFIQLYRQRHFPDSPIVYINATSRVDGNTAPDGCENLLAVATSPAMTDEIDWTKLEIQARDSVLRTMDRCGISFESKELHFERVQSPATFKNRDGNYRGSLYGADEKHRLFANMPLRNSDEEYSNLFYCGGSVQPGAGLPMVLLSGKFAAAQLAKAVGRGT